MKILLVDNYDSFTYNLVHYLEALDVDVTVTYNDKIDFKSIGQYDKLVLSPGPGLPHEAGHLNQVISEYALSKPILGVCLGFQALILHFGGQLYNQDEVRHGVSVKCHADPQSTLFKNITPSFNVGLYHSWAANINKLPNELKITAQSEEDVIMAFEHQTLPLFGVQFHPESILTDYGKEILKNFIDV